MRVMAEGQQVLGGGGGGGGIQGSLACCASARAVQRPAVSSAIDLAQELNSF